MRKQLNVGKNQDGSIRVYENPILEFVSHTPVYVPVGLYFLVSGVLLYLAIAQKALDPIVVTGLFVLGILSFSLLEYLVHRFLFHHPGQKEWQIDLKYKFHGIHHDNPKDKGRLVMPLPVSILLGCLLFGLFYLLIKTYAYGYLPGVLSGYSSYLLVHYIVHIYAPPKNFFKILWVNHAIHHYKDEGQVFGVSSPLWDYVFGTMPKKAKTV